MLRRSDGARCALSWIVYARGGRVIQECASEDEYHEQSHLFGDIQETLRGTRYGVHGDKWCLDIIDANNRLSGAARDARLRKLFRLGGLTLEIRSVGDDLSEIVETEVAVHA